jgi:hypothetical protein
MITDGLQPPTLRKATRLIPPLIGPDAVLAAFSLRCSWTVMDASAHFEFIGNDAVMAGQYQSRGQARRWAGVRPTAGQSRRSFRPHVEVIVAWA